MPVTVDVNGLSLCHKGCGGVVNATLPDVCKTPTGAGPVPIPYPNVSFSKFLANGAETVLIDGGNMAANKGSEFSRSQGDEPGTLGGVKSGVNMHKATWLSWSADVKLEGKNACRHTDKMLMNKGNTASLGGFFNRSSGPDDIRNKLCELACECRNAPRRQQCMRMKIENEHYEGCYPKGDSPVWTEVSMRQNADGVWEIILNQTRNAPTSKCCTPKGGIRPDLVRTDGAGKPTGIIEVKFAGDRLRPTQVEGGAYDKAARDNDYEYEILDIEKDCTCWDPRSSDPVPVPATSSESIRGIEKGGAIVGFTMIAVAACLVAEPCGAFLMTGGALAGVGAVLLGTPAGGDAA